MAGFLSWAFGGAPTASGESVTPESSLQQTSVYACIRVLTEAVASLPIRVYSTTNSGRKEQTNHPLANILRVEPNQEMSAFSFWEAQVGALNLYGNSYAEIQRAPSGKVLGISASSSGEDRATLRQGWQSLLHDD